ncbi:MAG: hypothetical protein KDA29_14925 [Phycisphaerales bacterium]|nr:hypothetical protein [Phycisphaerales bacterium]
MITQIEITDYNPEAGLIMNATGGKVQITHIGEGSCSISGDKDGLITLATALLTVAHNIGKAHPHAHMHVDEYGLLDSGSSSFVIGQLKDAV